MGIHPAALLQPGLGGRAGAESCSTRCWGGEMSWVLTLYGLDARRVHKPVPSNSAWNTLLSCWHVQHEGRKMVFRQGAFCCGRSEKRGRLCSGWPGWWLHPAQSGLARSMVGLGQASPTSGCNRRMLVHRADAVLSRQWVWSLQRSRDPAGWCTHVCACDSLGTGNGSGTGWALGTARCSFSALTRQQGVIFKILLSLVLEWLRRSFL